VKSSGAFPSAGGAEGLTDPRRAGGTFALYARLARSCKLPIPTATEQEFDTNLTRYGTKLEKGARPSLGTFVRTPYSICSLTCHTFHPSCVAPAKNISLHPKRRSVMP